MGQNCCVAVRDKSEPNRISHEASTYRNIRQSPTWNFRWNNRTHIEDIMENPAHFSHHSSGNSTSETKSVVDAETDGLSDGETPPKSFQSFQWRKSFGIGGSEKTKFIAADQSTTSNSSPERKASLKPSVFPNASDIKSSTTIASLSPPAVKVEDPSSSKTSFTPSYPSSSRKSTPSPSFQLYRQISDSRIPSIKSLYEGSSPEVGRHSFVLNNELSTVRSHGGGSDSWSMRTFSELVASSQKERPSFDNQNLKIVGSSLQPKDNHSTNMQACGICSKLLKQKSPWSTHKIVSTNDLPIAAVLVCGHVFHADCLENSTSETDIYDPPCGVCANNGEPPVLKPPGKYELKGSNMISRTDVADADGDSISVKRMRSGKGQFMGASSSGKSSFNKPFLTRHFSIGSRPTRSASQNETTRKKWIWPRYLRE